MSCIITLSFLLLCCRLFPSTVYIVTNPKIKINTFL
nr:MAG TPA: hypothetical protein [Caudoviricetes sp.]